MTSPERKETMPNKKHWAEQISDQLIDLYPERDILICAAGVSPSGIVHIGNFRDIITAELVIRALNEQNKPTKLMFFWDDFDRFRKVPSGIPSSFSQYLGMPLSEVPDPSGCHTSYAIHFAQEFEQSAKKLGINAQFIYQSQEYNQNHYWPYIKIALQKRKDIATILSEFKTQEISPEDIDSYYPLQVYCNQCRKDNTEIVNYDGESTITYKCQCGHSETVDLSKQNMGKLGWKIDWAMRWASYGICFEPGGKDHAVAGGSYNVSKEIASRIFRIKTPLFQGYEFVGIRGLTSKMSGSAGTGITPQELLQIYEPELLRWLFARAQPQSTLSFCFDQEIIRQYDEFDREIASTEKGPARVKGLLFARVDPAQEPSIQAIPFRQVAAYGQIAQDNFEELKRIIERLGQTYDEPSLKSRWIKSQNWVNRYMPQLKINVRETPNTEYYQELDNKTRQQVQQLKDRLAENWSLEQLTLLIYSIPVTEDMPHLEKQTRQRVFFQHIYQLLIGVDTGPRLPTFFLALGKERVDQLLTAN